MAQFEGYNRRIDKINAALPAFGFSSLDEAKAYTLEKGIDVENRPQRAAHSSTTPSGLTLSCAIALKRRQTAARAAGARRGSRPSVSPARSRKTQSKQATAT